MKEHRPHGRTTTSLEANVLKIRAFEMVLILFYMENLKRFILGSIQQTDKIRGENYFASGKIKTSEGKKMEIARARLVSEGVINQTESDELKKLMDYRNIIGHKVHDLTVDVGAYANLTTLHPETYKPMPAYDYTAAKRARLLREKIENGMMGNYIMRMSFSSLAFEAAEKTYLKEIKRLKVRTNKDIKNFNDIIQDTNRLIKGIPTSVMLAAQPAHPQNIKNNGNLSKHGVKCAKLLFEAKATPLAVAYMMRISFRAANRWFSRWKAAKVQD
ncbi:hypothetical protein [Rahnella sp. PAMC 25559]|uniref:hypothetical protein n=1 Tax=Rahnella sp. PAMC 25559 TaxID=3423225 RepID=UPI003D679574